MSYAFNRFRSFYNFHHRKTKLATLPLIAEIEPTNICNLNCVFCNREGIGKRGFGMMNFNGFMYVVNKYPRQLVHTRLFLHGESLLHPDIVQMVWALSCQRRRGVKSVGLTTNGTLLSAPLFRELVRAGLDNIEFSFEGIDKQTYEGLRKGSNYEKLIINILEACRLKVKNGLKVDIGVNIIDCKQTHAGLQAFVKDWSMVEGVNRVDVGELGDWAGTMNVDAYKLPKDTEVFPVCPAPWFVATIHWNGDVVPCCKWLTEPMGNIFRQRLSEIWNGQEFQALRKTMLTGRQNHPYCRNCKSNLFAAGSPYLTQPNRLYPFTVGFLREMETYIQVARKKVYAPLRRTKK